MAGAKLGGVLRQLRKLVGVGTDVDVLSDAHLLDRFASARDEAAFAELVRRHGSMVLGVGRSVLNDAHAAEDVFQATFLVLARKAASIRKQDSVGNWLYGVAYRIARNARVSAARRRERERQAPSASAAAAGEEAMSRELCPLFAEELNRLPEKYRAPLVLCYLEGKTNEEAAQELRWPSGTIKGRLARAREVLRGRLARRGVGLAATAVGVELAEVSASAAVPMALAEATVRSAARFAVGGAAAAGAAPAPVLALCHQALREMVMIKLKLAVAALVAACVIGTGVSWAAFKAPAGVRGPAPAKAEPPKIKDLAEPDPEAELADPKDEPIPAGARSRMGSLRLRHAGSVQALGFAPSLERPYLASASADGTVGIWDPRTGKEVRRIAANTKGNGVFLNNSGSTSLAISPNGERVAIAGADSVVTVWDIDSGKQLHKLAGTRVAYSPDGKIIATANVEQRQMQKNQGGGVIIQGGMAGFLTLYDAVTGKELRKLDGKEWSSYEAIAFTPDSKQVFAVGGNMDLGGALNNMPAGGALLGGAGGGANIGAGGGFGGFGGMGGFNVAQKQIIRAWDVETGKHLRQFAPKKGGVMALAFAPDGKLLATAGNPSGQVFGAISTETSAPITLWDPATGKEKGSIKGNGGAVTGLAFSPDSKSLASTGFDRTLRLWDVKTGKELAQATGSRMTLSCVAFGPDGQTIASGGYENIIRLWNVPSLKERPVAQGHDTGVAYVAFSPDGKRMITGASFDSVLIWDAATGKRIKKLPETYMIGHGAALSPDGKLILAGTSDQAVKIYDAETGKELRKLIAARKLSLQAAAFAADGKTVVVAAQAITKTNVVGEVKLWNAETGKEIRTYTTARPKNALGVVPWAESVCLSPDGKTLALQWIGDSATQLVDVATGKNLRTLGHPEAANPFGQMGGSAMAFSPDGRYLALANSMPKMANLGPAGAVGGFGIGGGGGFGGIPPAGRNADDNKGVFLYDTVSGKEVARLGKDNVRALAFAPDGRSLATTDVSESEIRVWEVASRKERCVFRGSSEGNLSLAFTPDGRTLAVGGQDTSVVLWDYLAPNKAAAPTDDGMAADLWERLAAEEASAACGAMAALAAAPKPAVALLQRHLKPAAQDAPGRVQKWIDELDSDQFDVREAATAELMKRGAGAAEPLRTALKAPGSTLEKRRRIERILDKITTEGLPAAGLREVRSIELLERIDTPEAVKLLESLAAGADEARLTIEAKAALGRVKQ